MQSNPKLKWGIAIVALIALGLGASFLVSVIQGMVAALVIAGIGVVAANFIPIFADTVAILAMKATRFQARTNPIETKLIEWRKMKDAVDQQREALEGYDALVESAKQDAIETVREFPHRREELERELAGRIALSKLRWEAWEQASDNLKSMKQRLDEETRVWKTALKLKEADMAARKVKGSPMVEVKLDAATDAIRDAAAGSVARLQSQLREMDFNKDKKLQITDSARSEAAAIFDGPIRVAEPARIRN